MKTGFRAAFAALALLVSVTACNDDQLPPAAGYSSMTGTLVDSTGKPVAGAVVTVDTVLTATTDASGKFSISNVPSGLTDYTVQATGYAVVNSSADIEPNKPFELDLTLAPAPTTPQH
jgi:hypothetical protein